MAFPGTLWVNGGLRAKVMTCSGVALSTTLPPRLRGWPSCVLMPVLHVFVMVFRILAARGALALEDASGACGDCGPVDGPSGVDDGLHRFDGGREPAFGGHDADVVEPHADRRPEALGRRHRHHRVAPRESRPRSPRCPSHGRNTGCRTGVRTRNARGTGRTDGSGRPCRRSCGGPRRWRCRTPRPRASCPSSRTPPAVPGTRIPRSRPAMPPPGACSSTGTTPPGNARPVPRPRPRPGPGRNRPARFPAPTSIRRSRPTALDAPPPTPDPALHRRVRAREPAFRHEPLVHAGRGMALLDRHAQVGGRPSVHDGRVPVVDQRPARSDGIRWPG